MNIFSFGGPTLWFIQTPTHDQMVNPTQPNSKTWDILALKKPERRGKSKQWTKTPKAKSQQRKLQQQWAHDKLTNQDDEAKQSSSQINLQHWIIGQYRLGTTLAIHQTFKNLGKICSYSFDIWYAVHSLCLVLFDWSLLQGTTRCCPITIYVGLQKSSRVGPADIPSGKLM